MMGRYSDPQIASILSPRERTRRWMRVELAWLEARFHLPLDLPDAETILDIQSLAEFLEQLNGHDVASFVGAVARMWPNDEWATRWFHYGLTSSDVVDTAESLQILDLNAYLGSQFLALRDALGNLVANSYGWVFTQTHGRTAEPLRVADVLTIWHSRITDVDSELLTAALDNKEGRFRGPAGNQGGDYEQDACNILGLAVATRSFQALNREIRAAWHHAVASCLVVLDALAQHVKRWICEERDGHLQLDWHSDGVPSSSMPHKQNPTALERIHGLSTLFASMQSAALHLTPMYDDRDIAHSSADRILHESGAHWLATSITTLLQVLNDCSVVPGRTSRPPSSFVSMHKLIDDGMSRQQAIKEVRG